MTRKLTPLPPSGARHWLLPGNFPAALALAGCAVRTRGLSREVPPLLPTWHCALVIGHALTREQIVLSSGATERLQMTATDFDHTWARAGFWGMVVLRPGRLPSTTGRTR